MKLATLVALFLLATPAAAHADLASIVSRDVPLGGERSLAGREATPRFNLVGLHWQGSGAVRFRTRTLAGRWSRWRAAAPEHEDGPDAVGAERSRPGWRLGNPYWTGASDRIEYRVSGAVRRLRAWFVWSPIGGIENRAPALVRTPAIATRLAWGANELIKRAPPQYAPTLGLAVVHHTAGSNGYSRGQAGAIVKAIQLYHVRGNGWNDIGYNFLVDKYGQVFEGRFGGLDRNVVGAHAQGFNTGSVGIAVLGTYGGIGITPAARSALVDLLAWRLDLAHLDPAAFVSALSSGNPRFPRGVPVSMSRIAGHRDTGFTDCPGDFLYGQLGGLAREAALTGLPKLYEPSARPSPRLGHRFTARLSAALPWTVTITDAARKIVGSGSGVGAAVDWTWDAQAALAGTYSYSIAARGVRPAIGTIVTRSSPAQLTLVDVRATPSALTPNGDGIDDLTTISYSLGQPAVVTATLVDSVGLEVLTLIEEQQTAGAHTIPFAAEGVLDGSYTIRITALGAGGRQVSASVPVLVNRLLSAFVLSRRAFSPNADGRADLLRFAYTLAGPGDATLRILRDGAWVATPFTGSLAPGRRVFEWDGSKRDGRLLDGLYEAELTVADVDGTVSQRLPFRSDTFRPRLRLMGMAPLRLHVSEEAEVVLRVDGRRVAIARKAAGTFVLPLRPRRLHALAWDPAGNVSLPLTRVLKRPRSRSAVSELD